MQKASLKRTRRESINDGEKNEFLNLIFLQFGLTFKTNGRSFWHLHTAATKHGSITFWSGGMFVTSFLLPIYFFYAKSSIAVSVFVEIGN